MDLYNKTKSLAVGITIFTIPLIFYMLFGTLLPCGAGQGKCGDLNPIAFALILPLIIIIPLITWILISNMKHDLVIEEAAAIKKWDKLKTLFLIFLSLLSLIYIAIVVSFVL